MFLGIKLFLEAIWEVPKTLAWMAYVIVLATLGACVCLGFAEGFGVGIVAAAVVYLTYGSSIRCENFHLGHEIGC
jgi:MFS superfamily sulfate permease-like transporter